MIDASVEDPQMAIDTTSEESQSSADDLSEEKIKKQGATVR